MGTQRTRAFRPTLATMATAYADQSTGSDDEFVIPENLGELSAEALTELHAQAVSNFDALYGDDGAGLSDDEFAALAALTDGITALAAEVANREAAATERAEAAAALAARVRGSDAEGDDEGDAGDGDAEGNADDTEGDADDAEGNADADGAGADSVEAGATPSGRRETRIPLSAIGRRAPRERRRDADEGPSIRDHMSLTADGSAASGQALAAGTGIDFADAGATLNARLQRFNAKQYEAAARAGRQLRQQTPLLQLQREIPADLQVRSNDPDHVREVFDRAGDETRLPGGSLVASGTGWCAPSTVLYDLVDGGESRDGLLDVAEVGAPRGGISFTTGVDFADLFASIQSGEIGFSFTEEDDVAGRYATDEDGDPIVGPKPCYHIECPPFEEYRLDVDGLCITAGLLQAKGYPEVIADTIRKTLIGHEHYMNGKMISQMAAGSTGVTLPATQAGTAAPLLSAIEMQVESYRYARRLARTTTLEAVFPYWIRGAIRSDLSRRLGVDFLSVPDARIDGWFRERGIAPQFVYNWQALSGIATDVTAWPTTVSFMLYAAGTWVRGAAEVITVESIYDSVMLGTNDYTALFTEEGWFVAKRGQDSRLVTTSLTADGVVAAAQDIAHNGTLAPAAAVPGATEAAPLFTSEVGA